MPIYVTLRHGTVTKLSHVTLRHWGRSEAARLAALQEFQPAPLRSTSTMRRHVVLGWPLFLLPSGVHPRTAAQSSVGSFLSTWPIQFLRGILGYKRDGGVRRIFLGLKFSTHVFFWVEDLTVYFFGSKKSARSFIGFEFPPG